MLPSIILLLIAGEPQAKVDSSKETVTFARPDMEHLRNFCLEKFGWDHSKTEGLLTPVLKARLLFPSPPFQSFQHLLRLLVIEEGSC